MDKEKEEKVEDEFEVINEVERDKKTVQYI